MGEQVPVRLILGLSEGQITAPEIQRARREPQRVDRQVQLGIGGYLPG
ncbi:Uncharacterised protein [Mycobacteroides abscessus subsp. abscessus]|nr:Uncharacterised protein [Mycobacteroides abscessus subsp. abscessus]SKV06755.1 Uncharacterised protein [Mycobacteroides abscessus subsp. abscessus]